MRLIVVGAGYVGLVTAVGFALLDHEVLVVETQSDRLQSIRSGCSPIEEAGLEGALQTVMARGLLRSEAVVPADETADVVFICVGTPIDDRGHADLGAVEAVLADLRLMAAPPITVVRSTLPVGTSRRLLDGGVVDERWFFSNPEFLRQGSALSDFLHPTRVVIGRSASADPAAEARVTELFGSFEAPLRVVTLEEAELIKNGANAFLALKLSFANELAGLAERSGADIGPVLDGIGLDPRIGATYLHPSFGFGGSCLPKELQTIAMAGLERGLEMHVTSAAAEANSAHQRQFAERIDRAVDGVAGRKVALLGLAFKAGTDDVRSSPALRLARWLLARDAVVHAFDPSAASQARRELPGLIIHGSALDALTGADVAVIATEWPEFRDLDWERARSLMAVPLVLDGRRLLDPARMAALGFRYERVGSPPVGLPGGESLSS